VAADVMATEAHVRVAERAIRRDDVSVVAGNAAVVADASAGLVPQVTAEVAHARVELLKDDGLCLDFANLLCDNSGKYKFSSHVRKLLMG